MQTEEIKKIEVLLTSQSIQLESIKEATHENRDHLKRINGSIGGFNVDIALLMEKLDTVEKRVTKLETTNDTGKTRTIERLIGILLIAAGWGFTILMTVFK